MWWATLFKLSQNSIDRREGVDSRLIEINDLALTISPIDFGIPEYGGIRTDLEQHILFAEGKSKADGVIKKSYHQTGEALDFYAYVNGRASWEEDHLTVIAAAHLQAASILGYGLEWGGFWESNKLINGIPYGWDMAHVQLKV